MIIIGIDPGNGGGLAMLNGMQAQAIAMPEESGIIDTLKAWAMLSSEINVWMEDIPRYAGKDVPSSSIAILFRNYGFCLGAAQAMGLPVHLVKPQKWQKGIPAAAGVTGQGKKRVLKDHASRLFPHAKPTLKTADALLIAHYGLGEIYGA